MSVEQHEAGATVSRHSPIVRTVHWSVAISTMALVFTGILQMPIAKRYFLDTLPGMAWTADYSVSLALHYLAAAWLIFASALHLAYHGLRREGAILPRRGDVGESVQIIKAMFGLGEEPPSHKFLAEQRLAYAFIAVSLALVIVSGVVKVLDNVSGGLVPEALSVLATHVHNLATGLVVFGIVAHLAAFLLPANRPLLPTMFTGRVDREYARHRHGLWFEELRRDGKRPAVPSPSPSPVHRTLPDPATNEDAEVGLGMAKTRSGHGPAPASRSSRTG